MEASPNRAARVSLQEEEEEDRRLVLLLDKRHCHYSSRFGSIFGDKTRTLHYFCWLLSCHQIASVWTVRKCPLGDGAFSPPLALGSIAPGRVYKGLCVLFQPLFLLYRVCRFVAFYSIRVGLFLDCLRRDIDGFPGKHDAYRVFKTSIANHRGFKYYFPRY